MHIVAILVSGYHRHLAVNTLHDQYSYEVILFQTVTVYDSADVELQCRVTQGVPSPAFRFFRNGTELDGTEEFISIEMVRLKAEAII